MQQKLQWDFTKMCVVCIYSSFFCWSFSMCSSSSSSLCSSSSSSRPSVPIVSRVYPWRDDNGYCWKYSENSGKAKHLGLGVFTCSHSLKECILTFDGSCHMLLCQIEREGRITEIKQGQPGHAVSIRCSQMLSKDRSVSWNDV